MNTYIFLTFILMLSIFLGFVVLADDVVDNLSTLGDDAAAEILVEV